MGKYDDIIDRLERADGPSRALDLGIWECLPAEIVQCAGFDCPAYTASLDAAIAITERLLPGWHPFIGRNVHHGYWLCGVQRMNDAMPDGVEKFSGQHDFNSPAIALLFGAFRALQAQDRE